MPSQSPRTPLVATPPPKQSAQITFRTTKTGGVQVGGRGRERRPLPQDVFDGSQRQRRAADLLANDGPLIGPGLKFDTDQEVSLDGTDPVFITAIQDALAQDLLGRFYVIDGAKVVEIDALETDPGWEITDGTVVAVGAVLVASAELAVGTQTTHDFSLVTNDTIRATILSTGETQFLAGANIIEMDPIATDPGIDMTDGTVQVAMAILNATSQFAIGTVSNHAMLFSTNNTTRGKVEATGELTFTNSTKTVQLDPVATNPNVSVTDGTVTGAVVVNAATNLAAGTSTNHPMTLVTNNTTRMTVAADGKITIAVGSNQVIVDMTAASPEIEIQNGTITATMKAAGTKLQIGCESDHAIELIQNNTAALTIDADGDVTIANDLTVSGQLRADKAVIGTGTPSLGSGDLHVTDQLRCSSQFVGLATTAPSALADGDFRCLVIRTNLCIVGSTTAGVSLSDGDIAIQRDLLHRGSHVGFGGVARHALSHTSMGARQHIINLGLGDSGMNTVWNT